MKTCLPSPTKKEASRIDDFRKVGCIACRSTFGIYNPQYDVHHIVRGKRLGHWFTIPLCPQHHRNIYDRDGAWTSIAHGRKAFERVHGSEGSLWKKTQYLLGMEAALPKGLS